MPTKLLSPVMGGREEVLPHTISDKTRRIYDFLANVYPASTFFFHSKAHQKAVECSDIRDGMRVLEVATGSGEMFRRLVRSNPSGATVGLDLSPRMAAETQRKVRRLYPQARTQCKAVDARHMPFRDESFDAIVCCYLLELLCNDDIVQTLDEFHRVLKRRGSLTLITIGQNVPVFNSLYKIAGKVAPAFWGRQVERAVPELIDSRGFRIRKDALVRQSGYPSRVILAHKAS
ncbi:MAG TPA: methyltransferase domain-containing protein [Bryobacteraceae bacterium]|jgi:ubiquinone/menaquinone biosynthesis C-methylase UbiE|nr:methyltransferase domain-containing protein [Bryobacteraceae bacterium]